MQIADCNDFEPEKEHGSGPCDPLGAFLPGLLTKPDLIGSGGFRVTDNVTDTVFVEPVCCIGLETWRDWLEMLDGTGCAYFGHDPSSVAERVNAVVQLELDAHGQDVQDFLSLAGTWAEQHLPAHAAAVTTALARALDMAPTP
ncbi:hypothetical protein AB0A76_33040 [Streptomyces exfoliatus]|uniref:CdiI immunity protein domain-containing protein n=1 Tax=Streptomyces exfoliatus TaxID=1905 RepID=A0ABV3D664_STREX